MQPVVIFVSYSHKDEDWVLKDKKYELIPWLQNALDEDDVEFWADPRLDDHVGEKFKEEILQQIKRADVAMVLISQDFLNSSFIKRVELPAIQERVDKGEIGLIPILVGAADDEKFGWLDERQILPRKKLPLIRIVENPADWQQAKVDIEKAVRKCIERVRDRRHGVHEAPVPPNSYGASEPLQPKPEPLGVSVPYGSAKPEVPANSSWFGKREVSLIAVLGILIVGGSLLPHYYDAAPLPVARESGDTPSDNPSKGQGPGDAVDASKSSPVVPPISVDRIDVRFDSPRNGQKFQGSELKVTLRFVDVPANVPRTYQIWLMERRGEELWPKWPPIPVDTPRHWTGTAFMGGDAGPLKLNLYLVPPEGQEKIRVWLQESAETKDYRPLRDSDFPGALKLNEAVDLIQGG